MQARQSGVANPPSWLIDGFLGSSYGQAYQASQTVPNLKDLQTRLQSVFAAQQNFNSEYYSAFVTGLAQQTRELRNRVIHEVLSHNLGKPALHIELIEDDWHEVFVSYQPSRSRACLGEVQNDFKFVHRRRRTVQSCTPVSARKS